MILTILGVPFAGALAVIVGVFDLIRLIGATVAAVGVGLVTLFADFPTATIVWVIFALAYQQFENYVIQPQIQKRVVELEPFIGARVRALGGALFGMIGALLAIRSPRRSRLDRGVVAIRLAATTELLGAAASVPAVPAADDDDPSPAPA